MGLTDYEKDRLTYRDKIAKFSENEFGEGSHVSYNFKTDRYHIYFPENLQELKTIVKRMTKQLEILKNFQFLHLGIDKKLLDLKKQINDAQVELSLLRKKIIDADNILKVKIDTFDVGQELKLQMIDKISFAISEFPMCDLITKSIDEGYQKDFKPLLEKEANKKLKEFNEKMKKYYSDIDKRVSEDLKTFLIDIKDKSQAKFERKILPEKPDDPDI